jgi:hypothetical protein
VLVEKVDRFADHGGHRNASLARDPLYPICLLRRQLDLRAYHDYTITARVI